MLIQKLIRRAKEKTKFFVFSCMGRQLKTRVTVQLGRQLKTRISAPLNVTTKILIIHFMRTIFLFFLLNSDSHLPKKIVLFVSLKALYKWWRMLFILSWKLFSFSRYLSFCHGFWSCRENCLIRKIMLISKFMTSQLS